MGISPREALNDPDLPFNLTVMRAHDAGRQQRIDSRIDALPFDRKKDPFTRVITLINLLLEEV